MTDSTDNANKFTHNSVSCHADIFANILERVEEERKLQANVDGQAARLALNRQQNRFTHLLSGVAHPMARFVQKRIRATTVRIEGEKRPLTVPERIRIARVLRPLFYVSSAEFDDQHRTVLAAAKSGRWWQDRHTLVGDADELIEWLTHRVQKFYPYYGGDLDDYEARIEKETRRCFLFALLIVRRADVACLPYPFGP